MTMGGLVLLTLLSDMALLGGRTWALPGQYARPDVAPYIHDIDHAREIVARHESTRGAEFGPQYDSAKNALGAALRIPDCWVGSIESANTDHACLDRQGYTRVRFVSCPLVPALTSTGRDACSTY
jgi:hypothetical protein